MDKIAGHLEGAAIDANILAHEDDPLVTCKRDVQRLADCLREGKLSESAFTCPGHCASSPASP